MPPAADRLICPSPREMPRPVFKGVSPPAPPHDGSAPVLGGPRPVPPPPPHPPPPYSVLPRRLQMLASNSRSCRSGSDGGPGGIRAIQSISSRHRRHIIVSTSAPVSDSSPPVTASTGVGRHHRQLRTYHRQLTPTAQTAAAALTAGSCRRATAGREPTQAAPDVVSKFEVGRPHSPGSRPPIHSFRSRGACAVRGTRVSGHMTPAPGRGRRFVHHVAW